MGQGPSTDSAAVAGTPEPDRLQRKLDQTREQGRRDARGAGGRLAGAAERRQEKALRLAAAGAFAASFLAGRPRDRR